MDSKRSFEKITKNDLKRLSKIAREDREIFFSRYLKWKKLYEKRIICVALCQGAALHYVNGKNGVKDFDVWTFYAEHPSGEKFPYRRHGYGDFGKSKFGRYPYDRDVFVGRCVDLFGRSIKCSLKAEPIKTLHDYLRKLRTKSAYELSKKAVVLLEPSNLSGKVVWPVIK